MLARQRVLDFRQLDFIRNQARQTGTDSFKGCRITGTALFEQGLCFFLQEFQTRWGGHSTTSVGARVRTTGLKVRSLPVDGHQRWESPFPRTGSALLRGANIAKPGEFCSRKLRKN